MHSKVTKMIASVITSMFIILSVAATSPSAVYAGCNGCGGGGGGVFASTKLLK